MKTFTLISKLVTSISLLMLSTLLFSQWEYMTPMPSARGNTTAAMLNGKIYVMGGTTSKTTIALKTVEIYDPETDSWESGTVPDMPQGVVSASSVVIGRKIYVIGGDDNLNNNSFKTVMIYDPDSKSWSTLNNMPAPSSIHTSSVLNEKVYNIGGISTMIAHNKLYEYDPISSEWQIKSDMPSNRALHTASVVDNKIFVLGGAYLGNAVMPIESYDPEKDEWSYEGEMARHKVFHGAGVFDKYIYIFAGNTSVTGTFSPQTWKFDTEEGIWEEMEHNYPEEIIHFGFSDYTTSKGDKYMYTFGGNTRAYYYGGDGPKVIDAVLRYKTSTETFIEGGSLSGTWICENSPYYINGDVWIEEGNTLEIEPCVQVIFNGHYRFDVYGQLLAQGTKDRNISFATPYPEESWNGIRIYDNNETLDSSKLVYCTIEHAYPNGNSDLEKSGGGIAIINSDHVLVENCTIRNNTTAGELATGGAGIAIAECSPRITKNLLYNNQATVSGHGGGILLYQSASEVSNNIVFGNRAWGGGGICIIEQITSIPIAPLIINNTIVDNFGSHGGGIDLALGEGNFINNIIYYNRSNNEGDQAHIAYNYNSTFYNNDIEGGFEAFAHDGGNFPPPEIGAYENNIDEDPMFLNPDFYYMDFMLDGQDDNNYSPCIEAGTDSILLDGKWILCPSQDFRNEPRPGPDGIVDIGAVEYPWLVNNERIFYDQLNLIASPNPSDGTIKINFNLDYSSQVKIDVIDVNGRLILPVINKHIVQGKHELSLTRGDLVQGVYFIRFDFEDRDELIKIVIN